jgi:EAL domain-containing protein (putative c-di-GMP-specific phosphodiesterase class I)
VVGLARWQHPHRGLLPPAEFIPLAEEAGLIDELTFRMLAGAFDQYRSWEASGLRLPVAVNLSAHSLRRPELIDNLADLLREKGVPPAMLTLEITESAFIANPDQALSLLWKARELGVRLSIDDFGTGYSSMAYLCELPVDELKIDRCFVARLATGASGDAIVRAVLELARGLDLHVVAEGVEDESTCDAVRALGCRTGQGYFFSRPLPAAELADWVLARRAAPADGLLPAV